MSFFHGDVPPPPEMVALDLPSTEKCCETPHHGDEVVELMSVDDGISFLIVIIRSNKQENETRRSKVKDAESGGGGGVFSPQMRSWIDATVI